MAAGAGKRTELLGQGQPSSGPYQLLHLQQHPAALAVIAEAGAGAADGE
jgi:hypothetical protein